MRLKGERAARRARSMVSSFRPLRARGGDCARVLLTGFGAFPGAPRNATAEIIRAIAASHDITLRARTFRAELVTGRGEARLPSGRVVLLSLMVLPVAWDAAAALVAREARALRASLVVMSGVAAAAQPIVVEDAATSARAAKVDAFGMRPSRSVGASHRRDATFAVEIARAAAERALSAESCRVVGVERRAAREENAYVCNATAHVTAALARRGARVLRSSAAPDGIAIDRAGRVAHGFVHWPRDLEGEDVAAGARVLLAMVDALTSESRGAGAV